MADVEFAQDLFATHDPLAFDERAVRKLRNEHGIVPRWCYQASRKLKGTRGYRAVTPDHPDFAAIVSCLKNWDEWEVEEATENGRVECRDLYLAICSAERNDRDRRRIQAKSFRHMKAVGQGSALSAELGQMKAPGAAENVSVSPSFTRMTHHADGKAVEFRPGSDPDPDAITVGMTSEGDSFVADNATGRTAVRKKVGRPRRSGRATRTRSK